jgi:hypothetical protein
VVAQLRTCEHDAPAQDVEDQLLETTRLGILVMRDDL